MIGIITSRSPMRHLTRSKPSGLLSLESASTRGFRYFIFSANKPGFLDKALYPDVFDRPRGGNLLVNLSTIFFAADIDMVT